jgi:hypothetical protein
MNVRLRLKNGDDAVEYDGMVVSQNKRDRPRISHPNGTRILSSAPKGGGFEPEVSRQVQQCARAAKPDLDRRRQAVHDRIRWLNR